MSPVTNWLCMQIGQTFFFTTQTVNDTAAEVREASFMALGTAMKVVTEKNIMAYLADVDSIKMQKVGGIVTVVIDRVLSQ